MRFFSKHLAFTTIIFVLILCVSMYTRDVNHVQDYALWQNWGALKDGGGELAFLSGIFDTASADNKGRGSGSDNNDNGGNAHDDKDNSDSSSEADGKNASDKGDENDGDHKDGKIKDLSEFDFSDISEEEQDFMNLNINRAEDKVKVPGVNELPDADGNVSETVAEGTADITIKYDDRIYFSDDIAEITDENITSSHVGRWVDPDSVTEGGTYDISEESDGYVSDEDTSSGMDTHVLLGAKNHKNKAVAVGCGSCKVKLADGSVIKVYVKPAKISLVLFAGQSNMEGSPSAYSDIKEYREDILNNPEGTVYNTYAPSDEKHAHWTGGVSRAIDPPLLTDETAEMFVPDSLTDNTHKMPLKNTNNLTVNKNASRKIGMDASFANAWYRETGEKLWIVNGARNGSSIAEWNPHKSENCYSHAVNLYKECEMTLEKEIEAGHYELGLKGVMWMQGEQNKNYGPDKYMQKFLDIWSSFQNDLYGSRENVPHVSQGLSFIGVFMVRANVQADSMDDLHMNGPRKALYYMTERQEVTLSKVYLASELSDVWTDDDAVKNYFRLKYGDEKNYQLMNDTKNPDIRMPQKVDDIHMTVHYSQLAYNEMGTDAAINMLYHLGRLKKPTSDCTLRLVSQDGYRDILNEPAGAELMTMVPKVYPAYNSKGLRVNFDPLYCVFNKWMVSFNYYPKTEEADVSKYKVEFSIGDHDFTYHAIKDPSE
ncbi:MAG: sialate O-acetylesterase [Lachnospiraceae bacterium]|jgi:hypothetical protein|nr:sialate O-acetylesterase [Lachnospiraceae bacterium]